jgi:regulatory protein YycI of two-component signal transduction system YycFG
MYAVAMNNFAKRINGKVNSETTIDIKNDTRNTSTLISYKVSDTSIRQHLEEERDTFVYSGKQYTFVKLKMPKKVFDELVASSKAQ